MYIYIYIYVYLYIYILIYIYIYIYICIHSLATQTSAVWRLLQTPKRRWSRPLGVVGKRGRESETDRS